MHESAVDWEAVRADAVALISRYVQFDTTNPPGDEMAAARWLCEQIVSREITQDVTVHEPLPGRGLLVARIPGEQALKPLVVNHHLDVVAADPAQWTYPPFSGTIADGFVWGRGTLDTKSLGIMFLLALQRLVREGARFRRPVVMLAVPDEEAGSQGMRWFVERFAHELDPEWVWDEGTGGYRGVFGPQVLYGIAVAEKQIYQVRLIADGDPGHGSMPHHNNATVTLMKALDRVLRRAASRAFDGDHRPYVPCSRGRAEVPSVTPAEKRGQSSAAKGSRRAVDGQQNDQRARARYHQPDGAARGLQDQRHPRERRSRAGLPPAARHEGR